MTSWLPPTELAVGTFRIESTFRLGIVGAALLIDSLALYVVVATGQSDRLGALALLTFPMVLLSAIALSAVVARLTFDGTTLTKRRLHGTRVLAVSAITAVSYVRERHTMNTFMVVFHGDAVASRIAVNVKYWERTNDLVQLALALDPLHAPDPITARLDADERWRSGERPGEQRSSG